MSSFTPLFETISGNDDDGLRRLLGQDPSRAVSTNEQGVSLLMWALYHRRPALAEIILAHHPGPNVSVDLWIAER